VPRRVPVDIEDAKLILKDVEEFKQKEDKRFHQSFGRPWYF